MFFAGKIRNVDRLERIKEEQRKIEQEAKEQAKIDERKQKEQGTNHILRKHLYTTKLNLTT